MPRIELIDNEYIGVSFQYDRSVVHHLRQLNSRRWNPEKKRWEIHVAHLAEVMKIFHLRPDEVPPEILDLFQNRWIRSKVQIRVSNSFTQIDGGQIPLDRLDAVTSFPVYGHSFDLKYLDGKWDGCKHLLDRRNFTFPTGLLQRVLDVLHREGVALDVEDRREPAPAQTPPPFDVSSLIPHQCHALESALESRRGLLELAPGAGKWPILSRLISALNRPTLFFTLGSVEMQTAVEELRQRLVRSVGQVGRGIINPETVTVLSTSAACKIFGIRMGKSHGEEEIEEEEDFDLGNEAKSLSLLIRQAGVVIYDDVQSAPSDTCYQLVMRCLSAGCRFGISTSPRRSDGHDMLLEAAFGPFIHRTDISMLIESKEAVPCRVIVARPSSYPPCERDRAPEEIFERAILSNAHRHELAAKWARDLHEQGRTVVVLAHDLDHAKNIIKWAPQGRLVESAGVKDSRLGGITVIPRQADALLDRPEINAIVLADAGASETKTLERLCRSLRPAPGKTDVAAVDFYDPAPYLKERSLKRLEMLRSQRAFQVETVGFEV